VNDGQVAQGITQALSRVEADGVIVEGNSFLEYVDADLTIMCARSQGGTIKASARSVLSKVDFLYLSTLEATAGNARRQFQQFCTGLNFSFDLANLPIITSDDFRMLLSRIYREQPPRESVARVPLSAVGVTGAKEVSATFYIRLRKANA
jgi:hypothetical protein